MGCLPACDQFKEMCDDLEKALLSDMPNGLLVTCSDQFKIGQKHVHGIVSKRYVDCLNTIINQLLVAHLPADS